jgi:abhydrolase domain-containing protein 14|uniref:AB hydrolase-1 domain-containing protein n=1 Tax=Panagrolaimus sp. PS1159 TaxID=55785 RepID=A0AC35GGM6_9BILA
MLERDPHVKHLIQNANLEQPLSQNCLNLLEEVEITRNYAELQTHKVFYFHAPPPNGNGIKANIVFVHDQTNSASVWVENGTLKTFAAFGYNCIALDLPGMGRTGGAAVEESDRPRFLCEFIETIGIRELIIIGTSQAGQYIIPLLYNRPDNFYIICVIAVALSDTNKLSHDAANDISTPCLVIRGELDTSLGLNAANNLRHLANARLITVPQGKHLCHRSDPNYFHLVVLNFLDIVLKNVIRKSAFVTNI